jgi:hypothetical protein
METIRKQFTFRAVPSFGDVTDMDVNFVGMPEDISKSVERACRSAFKKAHKFSSTAMRCTVNGEGDVHLDFLEAERSVRKPKYAVLAD